jgi:hypothetical protein
LHTKTFKDVGKATTDRRTKAVKVTLHNMKKPYSHTAAELRPYESLATSIWTVTHIDRRTSARESYTALERSGIRISSSIDQQMWRSCVWVVGLRSSGRFPIGSFNDQRIACDLADQKETDPLLQLRSTYYAASQWKTSSIALGYICTHDCIWFLYDKMLTS